MDVSAIPLQGLQEAGVQLEAAATRIATFGATSPDGSGLDTVDLSAEVVALVSAQNQSSANLASLKTSEQIQNAVIDLIA